MSFMKNSKDILTNAIEEVSEKELMEVAGGKKVSGWFATITDDCPNSVFVCC
ncbi:type A2 lanthipeptide [Streptococcus pyogenes]|uniref:type A2 lanthipeptide n=1 Tax=Streptococcus pyogenes TaxID=1314 RepID=UPI0010A1D36D|nr:type A2 lanthipeptide [Streptococcus pyogenes]